MVLVWRVYDGCMAKDVNYHYIAPIVAPNMMTVNIKVDGSADILFANAVSENDDAVFADVIAAVRFASTDGLKNLKTSIENALKEHESREP